MISFFDRSPYFTTAFRPFLPKAFWLFQPSVSRAGALVVLQLRDLLTDHVRTQQRRNCTQQRCRDATLLFVDFAAKSPKSWGRNKAWIFQLNCAELLWVVLSSKLLIALVPFFVVIVVVLEMLFLVLPVLFMMLLLFLGRNSLRGRPRKYLDWVGPCKYQGSTKNAS